MGLRMLTTLLDLVGAVCLAALAWFIWPPLAFGVVGAGCLVASYQASASSRPRKVVDE